MADPAYTFSETACSRKCSGATIGTCGVGVDDTQDTAEMVQVSVRVDHGGDLPVPAVLPVQGDRGGGALGGDQRVDHDDAGVALDQRHVRHVQVTDLVDPGGDLVQALLRGQLALPPQTGVHRGRGIAVQQIGELVDVPHHPAVRRLHDPRRQFADETPVGVVEVGAVVQISSHSPVLEEWVDESAVALPVVPVTRTGSGAHHRHKRGATLSQQQTVR